MTLLSRLLFLSLTLLFLRPTHTLSDYFNDDPSIHPNITSVNTQWMSNLPSNLLLSDLSIPGSFGSVAFLSGNTTNIYQAWNVGQQLEAGIRYFDLALGWMNIGEITGLFASQGSIPLPGNFYIANIFDEFVNFLKNNPKEVLIVNIKMESSLANEDLFVIALNNFYQELPYSEYLYNGPGSTFKDIPTLEEARGTIVNLNGKGITGVRGFSLPSGSNNDLKNGVFDVEGHYDNIEPGIKKSFLLDHFINANKESNLLWQVTIVGGNPLQGCFTLGANANTESVCVEQGDYKGLSKGLNGVVSQFFRENPEGLFGTIVMQFPGQTLINQIINSNVDRVFSGYNETSTNSTVINEQHINFYNPPVPRWVVGIVCGCIGSVVLISMLVCIYRDTFANPEKSEDEQRYDVLK